MLGWPNLNGIITKSAERKKISPKEGSSLSISLGNVFVSAQVPLLMPQYQLVLCKRINPFDSWLGKGTKKLVVCPIIKGIYNRFVSRTLPVSG